MDLTIMVLLGSEKLSIQNPNKQTIYFNNRAFKKLKGQSQIANYYDLKTGEEYWISGLKKDIDNTHKYGSGKIKIDKNYLSEFLDLIGEQKLNKNDFEITQIKATDKDEFEQIENEKFN